MPTAIKTVWATAWSGLPAVVHEAYGNPVKKAVMVGMFPTAFVDLDSNLRTYNHVKRNRPVDDEAEQLIADAVSEAEPTLCDAARNYLLFDAVRGGDDFGMSNPQETLSRFSWQTAVEYGLLSAERAEELLWQYYPPAATLKNLDRALRERRRGAGGDQGTGPDEVTGRTGLAAEIEEALARAVPFEPEVRAETADELAVLLDGILHSPALAEATRSTDPLSLVAGEQEAWTAILEHPGVGSVHQSVQGLGLAHALPVPVPGLWEPAPRPLERAFGGRTSATMPPPRLLEQSVVGRLRRALDVDRELLVDLAPAQVLRDEVERCVSPVGLSTPGAQAVFVVMRALALEIGEITRGAKRAEGIAATPLPRTPVGQAFADMFRRVHAAKEQTSGYARASHDVISDLADPTEKFVAELWGRAHGHDVRRSLAFTDLETVFRQLFLGVRETFTRRLDAIRGGVQLIDGDELPERPSTEHDITVDDPPEATRADAGEALQDVLRQVARDGIATRSQVGDFLYNADAESAYAEIWDRWRSACKGPEWLTYRVVCAVLPLLRQAATDDIEDE